MTWRIQEGIISDLRIGDKSTTAPSLPLGTIVKAQDAYWGAGTFILCKAAGVITNGYLTAWDLRYASANCPTTGNTARPVGVSLNTTAANDYHWVQIDGLAYCKATASVAAGAPVGVTGAGTIGATGAGIEVQGMNSSYASAATLTCTASTVNGSTEVKVPGKAAGFFVGIALSGTGVAGGATLSAISYDEQTLTMSAAATATGTITLTGTFTGYNIVVMDRPHFQGRIT